MATGVNPLGARKDYDGDYYYIPADDATPVEVSGPCEIIAFTIVDHGDPGVAFGNVVPGTAAAPERSQTAANGAVTLEVDRPQLWWPRGYGDQPLYELSVALHGADKDEALDEWSGRIGLRTVELDTSPDETGSRFVIRVNGHEVFCKGANWIPDDCFPPRVTPQHCGERIAQAAEANMNILRVWGGGLYESDAFYDVCDALGMMVWQDFLFACSAYAEEEPLRSLVEAEARHNIARLSRHPSLVIWNGCNENIWGYFAWGWQPKLEGRTWGAGYYLGLLPKLLAELDPTRPYWPGSPYSGTMSLSPQDGRHGNRHVWEPWFSAHWREYPNQPARFCSEFGFQGPATFATLAEALPVEELRVDSPGLRHHQKCPDGYERIGRYLAEDFPAPRGFDDWHYLAQVNQARAIRCAVEFYRSCAPECMGTIYWQLNDCWPVTSWSAIDGAGRRKPLWYATRRFFAPRLLTIQQRDGRLAVYAHNDTDQPWTAPLHVTRSTFDGGKLAERRLDLNVPPRTNAKLLELGGDLAAADDSAGEMLIAQAGGTRAAWFFDVDKRLRYGEPEFEAELEREDHVHRLTITAGTLLRDVCVFADRLDPAAEVSEQFVTLLRGEQVTFEIRSARDLDAGDLTAPPVFQCVNRFGG